MTQSQNRHTVAAHATAPTEPYQKLDEQYGKAGAGQSNQSWMSPSYPRLAVACEAFRSCEQLRFLLQSTDQVRSTYGPLERKGVGQLQCSRQVYCRATSAWT